MSNRLNELFDFDSLYEPHWGAYLDDIRPPERYVENLICHSADSNFEPRLMDFVLHGLSYREAARMQKLLHIERMKRALEYKKGEMFYTAQELEVFEAAIQARINEYNESA